MTRDTSIVIPTYNGASRVPRVLEALVRQDDSAGRFEVVVVDNASTDGTAATVRAHPTVSALAARGVECRVVSERRQGANYARIAGVLAAQAERVCFLDDDNIPGPEYVGVGVAAFDDPAVGLLISCVYPKWEFEPPPSVFRRRHLLAVNTMLGAARIDFGGSSSLAPTITAGMWVRRSAFLSAIPWKEPERLLPDRSGRHLACGGDIEFGVLIGRAGYHRVYLPSLRLIHEIPGARLHMLYQWRLVVGVVRSELTVRARYGDDAACGAKRRATALAALLSLSFAWPYLLLTRSDPLRETLLIAADRWARMRGPYRALANTDATRQQPRVVAKVRAHDEADHAAARSRNR